MNVTVCKTTIKSAVYQETFFQIMSVLQIVALVSLCVGVIAAPHDRSEDPDVSPEQWSALNPFTHSGSPSELKELALNWDRFLK